MPYLLPALVACFLWSAHVVAAPVPVAPAGPSPETLRQIKARRNALQAFELFDVERLPAEQRSDMLRKMEPALKDLELALASKDRFAE